MTLRSSSRPVGRLDDVASYDHTMLYRRARSLVGSSQDAWDLVQDTFERALRGAPADLPPEQLRKWLVVTLRNVSIDRHRRTLRTRLVPLTDDIPQQTMAENLPVWRRIDDAMLRRCVSELDPRLREAYLLKTRRRLSLVQIASTLGIPVSTAGTRLHRARRQLAERLKQEAYV